MLTVISILVISVGLLILLAQVYGYCRRISDDVDLIICMTDYQEDQINLMMEQLGDLEKTFNEGYPTEAKNDPN